MFVPFHRLGARDPVFLLSTGHLFSLDPAGAVRWTHQSATRWDHALAAAARERYYALLHKGSRNTTAATLAGFVPFVGALSNATILACGWDHIEVVTTYGAFVASAKLQAPPVGPPVASRSRGGRHWDILVVSASTIQGFTLEPSTDLSYFYVVAYGVIAMVVAVSASRTATGELGHAEVT